MESTDRPKPKTKNPKIPDDVFALLLKASKGQNVRVAAASILSKLT